jgi:hypothetical protein
MISLWFSSQILPLYIKTAHLTNHGSHACRGRIILQGIKRAGEGETSQSSDKHTLLCFQCTAKSSTQLNGFDYCL